MSRGTAARLGWSLFGFSALLLAVAAVLNLRRPQYADLNATSGELVLALPLLLFGWFGALIVSRQPSQPIGWILCAFGGVSGPVGFASEYAVYGLITRPGAVPGAAALAWFTTWVVAVYLGLLAGLLLLFPPAGPPHPAGAGGCGWPVSATFCLSSRPYGSGRSAAWSYYDLTTPNLWVPSECCTGSAPPLA